MIRAKEQDDKRCAEYVRVQMMGGRHDVRLGFADHRKKEVTQ